MGTLASFLTFMTILQMPVRQLGLMVNAFARASTCGTRLFELRSRDRRSRCVDARELKITEGTLRFENVSFSYPSTPAQQALRVISFEAACGETIGIVGPGSGKSTLAHLIPASTMTGGRVTIDGQDVRKATLSRCAARRHRAAGSFLFTTSIENNIAYGDPWAKESRIAGASESAQLNYVLGLPTGYDTVVGARCAAFRRASASACRSPAP